MKKGKIIKVGALIWRNDIPVGEGWHMDCSEGVAMDKDVDDNENFMCGYTADELDIIANGKSTKPFIDNGEIKILLNKYNGV